MKKHSHPLIHRHPEIAILANGDFPTHEIPLYILNNCKHLVACDGATNSLIERDIIPDAIVGDCDSLSNENKNRFAAIIHKIDEQETNDLTKAVHFCIHNGWENLSILGATGLREDHTIGNISLLADYLPLANVTMITNYGVFTAINQDSTFESYNGQQISIFPLDGQPISTEGLKYQIENRIFDRWWQATLNESKSDEFVIKTKGVVIVYRKF